MTIKLARQPETTVEKFLVFCINYVGPITSLDRWANTQGLNPTHVRRCAHNLAQHNRVKLDRQGNLPGRPYRVSALEEEMP